ncbi:MAG: hypothetical protein KF773_38765 [Deltaproteobacteria bacterium]|nr:hypothetical protein [Deltaproteobacteria bacterium]
MSARTPDPAQPIAKPLPPKPIPKIGKASATGRIVAAKIAVSVDGAPATDRPAYARAGQSVVMFAVLVAEDGPGGKTRTTYSDAHELSLGGAKVPHAPLADAPLAELRWNRIEPAVATMTNGDTPAVFRFEPIDYRATPMADGAGSLAADVRPTLTPDHGHGVGTMRYQLVALQGDRVVASAGPEARRGKGSGGLTDAVARVSIRRDDTYLGYLTEMFGQPYIWASAGITDATHQSERLEGSDCADFVVYAARRMGKKLAYTWTGGLPGITTLLAAGTRGADGVYRDKKGVPLPYTQAGDLVLFPRHVGVLAADRGQLGVLDDQDLMMHTLFDSPKEQAIADSGYADKDLELRRLRK